MNIEQENHVYVTLTSVSKLGIYIVHPGQNEVETEAYVHVFVCKFFCFL